MIERKVDGQVEFEPKPQRGSVEVITGCMFSGKSDELIRRLRRTKYSGKTVQVFSPEIDTRREKDSVNSYDGSSFPAETVKGSKELLEKVKPDTMIVAIDEAQFFDDGLPEVAGILALNGKKVIVAGLDNNFRGEGFGPMPRLILDAEKITKLHAVCMNCGDEQATRTQRIVNGVPAQYNEPTVVVGAEEFYEARCRRCHEVPRK